MMSLYVIPLLVALAPQEKAVPIQATIETFGNDPVLESGRLERGPRGLQARLQARFANEGLFRTGVRAVLMARSDAGGATQLLYLQQLVNPQGVPDIYQPITPEIVVELPDVEGLTDVVVLNTAPAFADQGGPLPAHRFAAREAQRVADGPADLVIRAEPLERGRRLVTLTGLRLDVQPRGRTLRYTVSFQVQARPGTLRPGDVQATVRRQVLSDEPPRRGDWLFVTAPARAVEAPPGAPEVAAHRFEVTLEAQAGPERIVIVGNPVGDPGIEREGPFAVLPVK